jgi:hypothetical protein
LERIIIELAWHLGVSKRTRVVDKARTRQMSPFE